MRVGFSPVKFMPVFELSPRKNPGRFIYNKTLSFTSILA